MNLSYWNAVQAEVFRIVDRSAEPFDPDTVTNTQEVLDLCRLRCPLPIEVAKGYWSTISLSWLNFEVEIFKDRVEVYRFYDKNTDIWEEEHTPGQPFSPRFLNELPTFVP